jgi:hypothetical protein
MCEMLYGTVKTTLAQDAVKGLFMESAHKEDVRYRMKTPCVTIRISHLYNQNSIFHQSFFRNYGPSHSKWWSYSPATRWMDGTFM